MSCVMLMPALLKATALRSRHFAGMLRSKIPPVELVRFVFRSWRRPRREQTDWDALNKCSNDECNTAECDKGDCHPDRDAKSLRYEDA